MSKDGGPAFGSFKKCGEVVISEGGVTVRDWFAGQALPEAYRRIEMIPFEKQQEAGGLPQAIARACYMIADAMLAERDK